MTKEEAIKAIKANYPSGGYERLCEALDMAIKALEDSRWIPVSERLPEESGWYLVSLLGCSEPIKTGYFGFFMKNGCFDKATTLGFKVTAWMPLPKPYEGSEEDAEEL